jgi:hypothetical protein
VGVRKAVCELDKEKRRYIGVKKAVSQGFYEIEREALYEETLRKRAAKKAASEENLRRRRLKNKTEKLFMKRIRKREGVELQRKLHLKGI